MNSCKVCNLDTLYTYCSLSCSNKDRPRKNEVKYNINPKLCKVCSSAIPYSKRWSNIFCSSSCAATFNNRIHSKRIKQPKPAKIDHSLEKFLAGELKWRNTIRKVLIKTSGNVCQICQLLGLWCNKSITLVVDHKNGNPSDNSPSNLRLLCPNCNSQTPTFSGRNKGNGRKSLGLPR